MRSTPVAGVIYYFCLWRRVKFCKKLSALANAVSLFRNHFALLRVPRCLDRLWTAWAARARRSQNHQGKINRHKHFSSGAPLAFRFMPENSVKWGRSEWEEVSDTEGGSLEFSGWEPASGVLRIACGTTMIRKDLRQTNVFSAHELDTWEM